jgi:ABC-type amino acid transport substrate-binding protein
MRSLFACVSVMLLTSELAAPEVEDLPGIRQRGVLRIVVTTDDRVAVAMFSPGTLPGFAREIIEGFAALQRLKVEFVRVPENDDRIPTLLAGKGDVIIGIVNTESRRKSVGFTVETFPSRHLALTRRPHPRIGTLKDLQKARIGIVKGSSSAAAAVADGVPRKNIDESYASPAAVIAALQAGRIDASVMLVTTALVERKQDPELELGTLVGPLESSAFAVRPGAQELRQALDAYITNLRRTPTWSRLVVKYYGDDALELLHKSRTGS